MRVHRPKYRTRTGERKPSPTWHVYFKDARAEWRRLPAFTDKGATESLGRKCDRLAATVAAGERPDADLARWIEGLSAMIRGKLSGWGLIDERTSAASRPLTAHLDDFEATMRARGSTNRHVTLVVSRARRVLDGCGFTFWPDVSPSKVERFLKALRDGTDERPGIGAQTSNFYLQAAKQFARWMVQDSRAAESPIAHLRGLNVRADLRRVRRALTPRELRKLLATTHGGPDRDGTIGPERALLYQVAVETGLRRGELESLTRASFDLDGAEPTVTVEAAYSKHRRRDVLPIRPGLVDVLGPHLAGKASSAPAFRVPSRHKSARIFREDLEAAGIRYTDDAGRVADFHALRHTLGSMLAASGVRPKVAQALMRHSSIVLTMDRYTHLSAEDERTALGSLPSLGGRGDVAQRATGTDGSACRVLAQRASDDGPPCPTMAIDTPAGDPDNAFSARTGGRVAEGTGLLNRRTSLGVPRVRIPPCPLPAHRQVGWPGSRIRPAVIKGGAGNIADGRYVPLSSRAGPTEHTPSTHKVLSPP